MNPDLEIVLDRERKRYQLMLELWRQSIGHTNKRINLLELGISVGLANSECKEVLIYLQSENLIKAFDVSYNGAISHRGIVEIEHSIKYPHQSTDHFHVQVIQNFHGSVGAVQNGPYSTSNIEQSEE